MCYLQRYDMRQTCVSCVLQCVSLQSNTLRVLSGFQRIGKYQKVLRSTKKYWNVSQSFASEMTESIVGVGGQGWHLYSLLDTVPYSHHITILRTALLTCSHLYSLLCTALLTCRHLYSLLRGRWRAADCRRSGLTLTLQTVNSDMLL